MSKLICAKDHQECFRYEGTISPSIETSAYPKGYQWEKTLLLGEIIIIVKGSISLSYDHYLNHKIGSEKIMFLPPGCHFKARTEKGVTLFIFRLKDAVRLCENFSVDKLKEVAKDASSLNQLNTLDVTENITSFLQPLAKNIANGLRCSLFFKQKIDELLILLRAYYLKSELAAFFAPVLSNTSEFTNFVLQNYRKVKTVKELADMYSCSLSCFDKKFRRSFGTAPYKWIQERKVSLIYHEINVTDKPIKQIAEEQKFSSLPQFNDYCKKHFGYPPGKMRKIAASSMKNKT